MIFNVSSNLIEDALSIKELYPESRGKDSQVHKRWAVSKDKEWKHVSKYFERLDFLHGTILWHNSPYPVHTDVWHPQNKTNVLIPLFIESPQKFFVFDQIFRGSCQWLPASKNYERSADSPDSHRVGRPCDDERVELLTTQPIDSKLANHLPEVASFYHGLTGTMHDYEPGTGIIFNSYNLHATGIMDSKKYKCALALWFNNDASDVHKILTGA